METANTRSGTSQNTSSTTSKPDPDHQRNGRRRTGSDIDSWTNIDSAMDTGAGDNIDKGTIGFDTFARDHLSSKGEKEIFSESKIKSILSSIGVDPENEKVKSLLSKGTGDMDEGSDGTGSGVGESDKDSTGLLKDKESAFGGGQGKSEQTSTGSMGRDTFGQAGMDKDTDDNDFDKADSEIGRNILERMEAMRRGEGAGDGTSLGCDSRIVESKTGGLGPGQKGDLQDEKGLGDY